MRDWIGLAVIVGGFLLTARIIYVTGAGQEDRGDAAFVAVVAALIWPIIWGVVLVVLPFVAVGWLISWPTKRDREKAAADRRADAAAAEWETKQLARRFNLPTGDETEIAVPGFNPQYQSGTRVGEAIRRSQSGEVA